MSNTIYHLINNEDYTDFCYDSYDESLLQEIMCDSFMDDVIWEFYYRSNIYNTYEENRKLFNQIWNEMLYYYNNYVAIIESEVI